MQIDTAIRKYARHQKSMNRADATIQWYNTLLHRFSRFAQSRGINNISGINSQLLLSYQFNISQSPNSHSHPYSVAVQNLHIIVIRCLYRHLIKAGIINHDPTIDIELARVPDTLPSDILTIAEMFTLLNQPDTTICGIRDRCMMELLYSTGMRRMEILGLNINDIYVDTASIFIRRAKGEKNRVVPFGSMAKKYLRMYLPSRFELLTKESGEAVFLGNDGRRMNKQMLGRLIHFYAQKAGIFKNMTPHLFRHTCATHLLNNGASILHIQKLLGHSRVETTTRYLRISIESLKKVHSEFHPREMMTL